MTAYRNPSFPNWARTSLRRFTIPFLVVVVVSTVHITGSLEFLERQLIDARFQSQNAEPEQNIVVAGIDGESMARLGAWPWPRSWHARVIANLHEADARLVVVDIDLSTGGAPNQDLALAGTLAKHGESTVLAAFADSQGTGTNGQPRTDMMPLDMFRDSADVAAVILRPDPDGKIRRMPVFDRMSDTIVPTLATRLALGEAERGDLYYLDFGIDADAIPIVSYVDVLEGKVDRAEIAGRTVVIGPTSGQLGTHVPVPRYRLLPATMVHVLAGSALTEGRTLERTSNLVTLAVAALVAFLLWQIFIYRGSLGILALAVIIVSGGSIAGAFATYRLAPILLDITPWILAALLILMAATAEQIQLQRRRIATLALDRRKSSRLLTLLFNALEEAVFTLDSDGRILTANSAASRMFTIPRRNLVGRDIADLLPPGASIPTAGRSMIQALLNDAPSSRRIARRADGTGFPVDLTVRSYSGNDPTAFLLTIHDISEYEEAERKRRAIEEQLFDAMESFGEPFAMYSPADRLVMCNSAFRDLFPGHAGMVRAGTSFEALIGIAADTGQMKLSTQQREIWRDERASLAKGGQEKVVRTIELANDRWLTAVDQRTRSGGFISILLDSTDAKRREAELYDAREAAEHANHAKSEFLANMSHELRTPLNAVIGFSEMISREMRGPIGHDAYVDYGRAIHEGASHLLNIVNEILDLSRIESGSIVLQEERIDLRELMNSVRLNIFPNAREIEIGIDVDVAKNVPDLWADERLIKQILINLLSNAVKFSGPGDRILMSASRDDSNNIRVDITDQGIGIAEADLPLVLEPFGQVENAMNRSHDGVGLGLSLARLFAKAHDAELSIVSKPGAGTCVTVVFPAARARKHQVNDVL